MQTPSGLLGAISACLSDQKAKQLQQKNKQKDMHPKKTGNQQGKFDFLLDRCQKVRQKFRQKVRTQLGLKSFCQFFPIFSNPQNAPSLKPFPIQSCMFQQVFFASDERIIQV